MLDKCIEQQTIYVLKVVNYKLGNGYNKLYIGQKSVEYSRFSAFFASTATSSTESFHVLGIFVTLSLLGPNSTFLVFFGAS